MYNKKINMMKYFLLFTYLLLTATLTAEIAVKSFRLLENDLDARVNYPLKDQNGDPCAIIKVVTTQKGFSFDGGMTGIVKTVDKPAEIWVYVPWGLKRITISHPQLGMLRDYMLNQNIEKATVYEMVLISGRVETTVVEEITSQWLVINPEPADAAVYINDEFKQQGAFTAKYKPGLYAYRVEAPMYHAEAGSVEIRNSKVTLDVKLKPAFGFITVNTTPEQGATVIVDGKALAKTTPVKTEALTSGEHTVQVMKEMFAPASQKITVGDGQTIPLNIAMQAIFAELSITASPDAAIFINNVSKGKGSWKGRLGAGIYSLEAKADKHRPAKQDVELVSGDSKAITLQPTPIYGSLDVISNPIGATITINGKDYGITPNTINKLLIGEYTVQLAKSGYANVSRMVTVSEGKSAELNETLNTGRAVNINSNPTGAELFVDNQRVGTTPYSGNLTIGNHVLRIEMNGRKGEKTIIINQAGGVVDFNLSFFPTEIVDVYNPKTGKTWMDRNLGASRAATSSTDKEAYGDLYQWGRGSDGHEKRNSGTTSTLSNSNIPGHGNFILEPNSPYDWRTPQNNNLWQGAKGVNNPCPTGYRLPTRSEFDAERASWSSQNLDGAFASTLRLPMAGYRNISGGSLTNVGSYGGYWSSTVNETFSWVLFFVRSGAEMYGGDRAYGYSVRCIKD
jgi:uncharacterized protein (TIGR02145 family)